MKSEIADKIKREGKEILIELIQVLENNGFEVNLKKTDSKEWEVIEIDSVEFSNVLYVTQDMIPKDYGSTLNYRYSIYEYNGFLYELTWDMFLVSSIPTIKRKNI